MQLASFRVALNQRCFAIDALSDEIVRAHSPAVVLLLWIHVSHSGNQITFYVAICILMEKLYKML
jgi:hypothetical protein